jgi:F-type H+-transporting ATPase subunit gamma
MKSSADIKKRIKSVANTQQITKAMEVVSATKMRKSQDFALKARPYAFSAFELLASASRKMKAGEKIPALLLSNESKKTLAVIVASDKGLAGSLNANVMRKAHAMVNELKAKEELDIVTVGKKATAYFTFRKFAVAKEFIGHGDFVDITEMNELHDFISAQFLDGTYGKVVFVYTNFLSTLRQEPVVRQVLPVARENLYEMIEGLAPQNGKFSDIKDPKHNNPEPYLFEPSREVVLKELADRLFKMTLYHIQLESNASEHSARMVAMKTASDNAAEIVDDLTLIYNKGRQAKITQEIMEITSGSDAVG